MMGENPSWWIMHPLQYVVGSSSLLPYNQDLPQSWSQLLLGEEEEEEEEGGERFGPSSRSLFQTPRVPRVNDVVNQELNQSSKILYGHSDGESQIMPAVSSSPSRSCISSNMLDFSHRNKSTHHSISSECNSRDRGGGVSKKARVQSSSTTQPSLKVRKEKLGDRITALHQLVSPFGKTDTASVLLETIGYIRFLEAQIQALSSPYLTTVNTSSEKGEKPKDLRSRGLCLVTVSCTQHVGGDNGADYWAPAAFSGRF